MADFPASLKPSVTQGYSFDSPANILTQEVQGGAPLMMLDYARGPVPFNIGLVMTPSDLQTFQEFYVNEINNGAGVFDINLDSGRGIETHTVSINTDSLNIDGSRAPIWLVSFTVTSQATPIQLDTVVAGFSSVYSHADTIISEDKKTISSDMPSRHVASAVNILERDTYWETQGVNTGLNTSNTFNFGIVESSTFPFQESSKIPGVHGTGAVLNIRGPDDILATIDGVDDEDRSTTFSYVWDQRVYWKYTASTRATEVSPDGISWEVLWVHPVGRIFHAWCAQAYVEGSVAMAFVAADIVGTVPSGYSTYDNDYTAP